MTPSKVLAEVKAVLRDLDVQFSGNRISRKIEGYVVSIYHIRGAAASHKNLHKLCSLISGKLNGLQVHPVIRTINRVEVGPRVGTSLKIKVPIS